MRETNKLDFTLTPVSKADFSCRRGPKLGHRHSEETKRKIGESRIGFKHSEETKRKIGDKNRGSKRSEESKRRMREAKLGGKHSEETKEKMSQSAFKRFRKPIK